MSIRTFSQEKQELLHIVMDEMEKRHFIFLNWILF